MGRVTAGLVDTIALNGQVVGPDGKPIADAQVYVTSPFDREGVHRGTTGADGSYVITLVPGE